MTATADALIERAKREQHVHPEQLDLGLFEHLIAHMPALMRVDQVRKSIGWERSTIYALCESGDLNYHTLPDRQVKQKQITRTSVAALLMRTASYTPEDYSSLIKLTLAPMTVVMLRELLVAVQAEISRKTKPAR